MSDDKLKIAVNRPFQAGSDKHVMVKHRGLEHLSVFMDLNSRPHDTTQKLLQTDKNSSAFVIMIIIYIKTASRQIQRIFRGIFPF